MRIRRIELNGFKSFMDRTTIDLPEGVTAIVGPNGCGKSNVVDAIRWVLGEQSPKHLRGASMEDVIFAGNAQQGPMGMAEVSLLLERSEEDLLRARTDEEELAAQAASGLPPELAQASEVLVTRRYFRSGESEYFINRAPCRLRDITELFLGTGVGTKAYAIIEQGRVEQLVSAKPEELRLFIEEAAGTTRYRSRKQSAERKMARTRENLVRVQDVLREQQRQIASLERQAKRAEEYRRLKGELRALDLRVAGAQHRSLLERRHALAVRLGVARSEQRRCESEVASLRAATSEARGARTQAEERLREIDEAHTAAQVAAADGQARVESLEARRLDASEQVRAATEQHEASREAAAQLRTEIVEAEEALAAAQQAEHEAGAVEATVAARLAEAQRRADGLEGAVEAAKDALVEAVGEETRLRNMDQALRERREELDGRRRRLEEEQRLLGERLDANQRGREEIQARLEALAERHRAADAEHEALAAAQPAQRDAVEERAAAVEAAHRECTQVESRIESLEELQSRAEGCTRGAASLVAAGGLAESVLADVLRVPESLERAVAVALRSRLGDVVVETTAAALEAVRWLVATSGGSATALPRTPERRATTIVPAGRRLLDEIEVDPENWALAESLLGDVLVAEDLDTALETWRGATHPVMVVTRGGEAVDPLGGITGGSEPPLEETLLARRRELRVLAADLEAARERLAARATELEETRARLTALEADLARVGELRQQLRLERLTMEKDRDRHEEERARLAAELEVSALEVSGVMGAGGELAGELAQLDEARARATRAVEERRLAVEEATAAVAAWREAVAGDEAARREAAVARAAMGERIRAAATTARAKREGLAEHESRLAALQEATAQARARGIELLAEIEAGRTAVAEARARIERLGLERGALAEEMAALGSSLETDDRRERELRDVGEDLRTRRGEWEVQLTETGLQIQHVEERLRDRWDLGLTDVSADGDTAPPTEAEFERAEILRTRLVKLGDVNPGAIEELEELRERHGFVEAQRRDLEKSLADLEHTIDTLNRTCRQRFRETFEAANAKLGEVFPQLFPGGKASLELVQREDEEEAGDGQEAGVEIVVQPAGKKLQSLGLLSGGEKALTATALVFSLFLIRPTPFCLLDEVDAPLDEANIGRFNQMVREMAATSQFVVVTHNRRTMEGADTLYGITMEQAGVSKVVSVRLNEAA